jgi:cation-transporting P-type ATPase 13A2
MAESVPNSISSFQHRRGRADSTASFTYFNEEEQDQYSDDSQEEAVLDDSDREDEFLSSPSTDLEANFVSNGRRKSSTASDQEGARLLKRHTSETSTNSPDGRASQKIYIQTEDLTIVIAGFTTSHIGAILYFAICICTLGLGYLLFRWLPRWRVRIVGAPTPLRNCTWVVIEVSLLFGRNRTKTSAKLGQNQWGEFAVHDVKKRKYGQLLSKVFGASDKPSFIEYDEDDDPVLEYLRFVDYRYIRFSFHPLKDKFVLNHGWKDPAWTNVKEIRVGIDSEEQENREHVFGKNVIDIEEKSIPQLLMDEVWSLHCISNAILIICRSSTPSMSSRSLV